MPCYRPLTAYFREPRSGDEKGAISFSPSRGSRQVELPCGCCFGCRSSRALEWAVRCVHESKLHELSIFVTLTYDDDHVPPGGSLCKRDVQLFLKKLRKKHAPAKLRYFVAGEYGDTTLRPHYHALLFGIDFPDKVRVRGDGDRAEYRSDTLDEIWSNGSCIFGSVTSDSAAYTAGYVYKKQAGVAFYDRLDPETGEVWKLEAPFALMSRKPGLGAGWYRRFSSDYFPSDEVIFNGAKVKVPRYYQKLAERDGLDLAEVRKKRIEGIEEGFEDSMPKRLRVREEVAKARRRSNKREFL